MFGDGLLQSSLKLVTLHHNPGPHTKPEKNCQAPKGWERLCKFKASLHLEAGMQILHDKQVNFFPMEVSTKQC